MRAMSGLPSAPAILADDTSGAEGSSGTKELAVDQNNSPTLPHAPVLKEFGGRDGPEPTRFGDWEKSGRCIDF